MTISRREFLGRILKTGFVLAIPTILTRKAKAETYNKGRLELYNDVNDYNFIKGFHTTVHASGQEGFDTKDSPYGVPWELGFETKATKIVSIISEWPYELHGDARPIDSFTPINLELSLHQKDGNPINASSLQNWLRCVIDPMNIDYDFGNKPLTLWRRFPAEPDKLQFLADIREACAKQGGTGIVPLPNLNGEYASQVPYDFLQLRFDVYPGNLNFSLDADGKVLDGIVDMKDLAILGNDWGKQGEPKEFVGDITGPQGLPDGKVDYQDLELLTRYWLKDIRDIMPSP
jgi:hypothetical protein